MTRKLVVLADDFTGACDAAAPFAAAGCSTQVLLQVPPCWPSGVEVLSVDLDVRAAAAEEARAAIRTAARQLAGEARLLLKIDSTLRGPVGALVQGALEGSGHRTAVVAPAFPEQGRVYLGGRLGGDGASVLEVLGAAAQRCLVVDDLLAVDPREGMLLVGSGGLARRLAGPARVARPRVRGKVLVVAGSPAAETQRQLERLPAHVEVLRTAPSSGRDTGEAAAGLARNVARRAERPGLLVLTGGQTGRLVCEALAVEAVELSGEVLPGVPIGKLRGGPWHDTVVVTKAGGFGGPDALLDVLRLVGPSSEGIP